MSIIHSNNFTTWNTCNSQHISMTHPLQGSPQPECYIYERTQAVLTAEERQVKLKHLPLHLMTPRPCTEVAGSPALNREPRENKSNLDASSLTRARFITPVAGYPQPCSETPNTDHKGHGGGHGAGRGRPGGAFMSHACGSAGRGTDAYQGFTHAFLHPDCASFSKEATAIPRALLLDKCGPGQYTAPGHHRAAIMRSRVLRNLACF